MRFAKATGGVEGRDGSSGGGAGPPSAGRMAVSGFCGHPLQLTGIIHTKEMEVERSTEERMEELDDGSDKQGLVGSILCLPLVRPRKGDVEREGLDAGA